MEGVVRSLAAGAETNGCLWCSVVDEISGSMLGENGGDAC
jgi:hypothetical protein